MQWRLVLLVLWLSCYTVAADTYTGTNAPGSGSVFPFALQPGVTNCTLTVDGDADAFSYLFLKAGGEASTENYDYRALLDGQGNAIGLELPECMATNYGVLVYTPESSLEHVFTVTLATNAAGLRAPELPVSKPQAFTVDGSLANGQWHCFRVEIPENSPGWRLVLNAGQSSDLYVRKDAMPQTYAYDKVISGTTNGTLILTETEISSGTWYVGVYGSGAATDYELFSEIGYLTVLTWDQGETHLGTVVFTNASLSGGDYYFKIVPQSTDIDAWRTALNVEDGEADVYMQNGWQPHPYSAWQSSRAGSDGFVLHSSQYGEGQEWFMLVRATPGAQWNLVSGRAYVTDLGELAADGSSGSGPVDIGAEGIRLFRTTVPAETLAWRLWLNGENGMLYVNKSSAALPASHDLSQSRQMLVVPDYLGGDSFNGSYFVSVPGDPGDSVNLDSRRHSVSDLDFSGSTHVAVTGYGYTTYRVQVPVEQIAWQVKVAAASGNPNVAVRREKVPNEFNNDAFSEVGGLATDSLTLVPPTLSDGTFYVTVYGVGAHTFTLTSGNPVITDIPFTGSIVNDDPGRAGWRYFRVADIEAQLGHLGWDLLLRDHVPGTEIALRRNAVPGRWHYRQSDSDYVHESQGHVDYASRDFLQRPGHQADIWYVGIYMPEQPLGAFELITRPLVPELVAFDGMSTNIVNQPVGKWQYFRIEVPEGALGWDIRIKDVTSGDPRLVLRRDLLPNSLESGPDRGGFYGVACPYTDWPSGHQWGAYGYYHDGSDWTGRAFDPSGTVDERGRIIAMGMGNPLEPGTYYVGVLNGTDSGSGTNVMSYTLLSRGIGEGQSIPVVDVDFAGGSAVAAGVAPREAAYYRVTIPEGAPSWQARLTPTVGEALLKIQRGALPCMQDYPWDQGPHAYGGKKMQKEGPEQWLLLPDDGTNAIPAGTYYLAAVSEGQDATNSACIGTGSISWTVESFGELTVQDLGTVGETDLTVAGTLQNGAVRAYQFTVPEGVVSVEVVLESRTGNPWVTVMPGSDLPTVRIWNQYDYPPHYGNWGGNHPTQYDHSIVTVVNPSNGTYSVCVFADNVYQWPDYEWPDAGYTLRVRNVYPPPVAFDGGSTAVTGHSPGNWRFFKIEVPEGALGWDIRLKDVSSGDPRLVVRRDLLPNGLSTMGFSEHPVWSDDHWPYVHPSWRSGGQWAAGYDWSDRAYDPSGTVDERGRILAMGMGNPLEPGSYYVGVINGTDTGEGTNAMSYTLLSRGIGDDMAIPVTDMAFAGGSVTTGGVAPREAAYYRVEVPEGAASWQVRLTPTVGEALLSVQWGTPPCIQQSGNQTPHQYGGKKMQKEGPEQWLLLPENGSNTLQSGTYYLAVVSEGRNPGNYLWSPTTPWTIGTESSSWMLTSAGEMPVHDLGTVGAVALSRADALAGGAVRAYQFTVPEGVVSVEVVLEDRTGNPWVTVMPGTDLPTIRTWDQYDYTPHYGNWGGNHPTQYDQSIVTVVNPVPGTYSVCVFADSEEGGGAGTDWPDAGYTLRVRNVYPPPVAFDGGSTAVTDHAPGNWRFFKIEVPEGALGWDIRLKDVSSGDPRLVVRRDLLPTSLSTYGEPFWYNSSYYHWTYSQYPCYHTNWVSGNQWAAGADWTGRAYDPSGETDERGRIIAMGMGNPLEPGTYYVGVLNGTDTGEGTNAMSYTLLSRGIGAGLSIPVVDVDFAGGSAAGTGIAAREAAYYRVTIPEGAVSWQARLTPTVGEALLKIQRGALPCIQDWDHSPHAYGGKKMQKEGPEQWLLLPENGSNTLQSGTYYLAAVSEGQNVTNENCIGTGSSSWTVESVGELTVQDLGIVGETDLTVAGTLQNGAVRAYQFTVPEGVVSVEVVLENRTGNPWVTVMPGADLPTIRTWDQYDYPPHYGNWGGNHPTQYDHSIVTVVNPVPGTYSVCVFADNLYVWPDYDWPDAGYTLKVRQATPDSLNFCPSQNTNGLHNAFSGTLANDQRSFFRIEVPESVNGVPVVGWRLDLTQTQGTATMRACKDHLPTDDTPGTTAFIADSTLVVPPFLTPGTWYVEVRGEGSTAYTLTSSMFETRRPAWEMPVDGDPVTTPGLTAPEFGDTGTDTNGVALPGDRGIDLENGRFHYYAVNVPEGGIVLMRTMIEAISGNPDLYIRAGAPPTLSHNESGNPGALYERSSTGTGTEYGNWVPYNGRAEVVLTGGIWYFGVRAADNANCRYRLRFSSGGKTDLALDGGSVTGQALAGGDWRYYRVVVPTNAPDQWTVTFSQQQGDVVMYVRDTVPPSRNHRNGLGWWEPEYLDWDADKKNDGPYGSYDAAGTYTFQVPPLRPGHIYYLGFRAVNDAMFSVSSSISGTVVDPVLIPFNEGSVETTIPAGGSALYAVDVPGDASRLIQTFSHSADVHLYMEQGTVPYLDNTADWSSVGNENSRLIQNLGGASDWPWVRGQRYYIVAVNTSAEEQAFGVVMSGPDLAPVALAWTDEPMSGRSLEISATVTNRNRDAALPDWYDSVYLSEDNVLDDGDTHLGGFWNHAPVAGGEAYAWTNTVWLPDWQPGVYNLIVKADHDDRVFESDEGNNAVAVPLTLTAPDLAPVRLSAVSLTAGVTLTNTVTLAGPYPETEHPYTNNTAQWWTYTSAGAEAIQVAFDGRCEGDDWTTVYVQDADGNDVEGTPCQPQALAGVTKLVHGESVRIGFSGLAWEGAPGGWGLAVTNIEAAQLVQPAMLSATPAEHVRLNATITNRGNGVAMPSWYDEVYLSTNGTMDGQVASLGYVHRPVAVADGEDYHWGQTVNLPQVPAGDYWLILRADIWSHLYESDETNNDLALPIHVVLPDLEPTNLEWPRHSIVGRSMELTGTVTNLGSGTAMPNWYDAVYLSADDVLDDGDAHIGSFWNYTPVAGGEAYTWTNTVWLPDCQPGSYYLIVKDDNDDRVFEGDETNNTVAFPVTLTLPDPDDRDDDGMSNEQELDLGRDPDNPADGGAPSRLTGVVSGAGFPLEGAYVALRGASGQIYYQATTDGSGGYVFTGVESGHYYVKVGADSYADEWYAEANHRDVATTYEVPVGADISDFNFDLAPGQSIALVEVTSDPAGAEIYLDFWPIGQVTPAVVNVGEVGEHDWAGYQMVPHVITVRMDGCPVPSPQSVPAVEAETVSAYFNLVESATGAVAVATVPDGAEVYIDDADTQAGVTPLTIGNLAPGFHTVLLRKPGYLQPRTITAWVSENQMTAISLPLATVGGAAERLSADVRSVPSGIPIHVGYLQSTQVTDRVVNWMDAADYTGVAWTSCTHTIMLRLEGTPPLAARYVPDDSGLTNGMLIHLNVDAEASLDSDADGIPDWWWSQYGYDPGNHPDADSRDGSGMTYREKMLAGLVPGDSSSRLAVGEMSLQRDETGLEVTFVFATVPGRRYLLQARDNLSGSGWVNLSGLISATEYHTYYTTRIADDNAKRFYRLVVLTQ